MLYRVKVDFTSEQVKPLVIKLYDQFQNRIESLAGPKSGVFDSVTNLRPYLDMDPEAGAGLLLSVLTIYQAYFHRLSSIVNRVDSVLK